jgi:8-oxo-dGTP pyrophosphatase MutT (NUDIX family)
MPDKNLPQDAKLVFKGRIFDVYQWEQKMFDGTSATFERLKRPDTVVIIPTVGNKIVVLEEDQPYGAGVKSYIDFPAGRADKEGAEILDEAKRELVEETGYASEDWELLMSYEPHGKIIWTVYVYMARNCKKVADQKLDAGEKITARLTTFEEMLLLPDDPKFRSGKLNEELLRMRLDPLKKEEFRKLLFP